MLITGDLNGSLAEWDAHTGEQLRLFLDGSEVKDAWIEDENGEDIGMRLVRMCKPIGGSSLTSVCFSRDGKYFAVGAANGWVVIWSASSGVDLSAWEAHQNAVVALDFSPDQSYLATGCHGVGVTTFSVWRIQLGRTPPSIRGQEAFSDDRHIGGVSSVCFSPDNRHVVSGGFTLSGYTGPKIYDLTVGECVHTLPLCHSI